MLCPEPLLCGANYQQVTTKAWRRSWDLSCCPDLCLTKLIAGWKQTYQHFGTYNWESILHHIYKVQERQENYLAQIETGQWDPTSREKTTQRCQPEGNRDAKIYDKYFKIESLTLLSEVKANVLIVNEKAESFSKDMWIIKDKKL